MEIPKRILFKTKPLPPTQIPELDPQSEPTTWNDSIRNLHINNPTKIAGLYMSQLSNSNPHTVHRKDS